MWDGRVISGGARLAIFPYKSDCNNPFSGVVSSTPAWPEGEGPNLIQPK